VNHSTIVPKLGPSLAQANRSRSGERDHLAQAREILSLKQAPSRLGEGSNKGTMASAISRLGEPLLA